VMRYFESLRDFRWHYLGRRSRRVGGLFAALSSSTKR
jgi:hypothetical protein